MLKHSWKISTISQCKLFSYFSKSTNYLTKATVYWNKLNKISKIALIAIKIIKQKFPMYLQSKVLTVTQKIIKLNVKKVTSLSINVLDSPINFTKIYKHLISNIKKSATNFISWKSNKKSKNNQPQLKIILIWIESMVLINHILHSLLIFYSIGANSDFWFNVSFFIAIDWPRLPWLSNISALFKCSGSILTDF